MSERRSIDHVLAEEATRKLDELPPVLTVEETAGVLRIGRGSAYDAVRRGEIPSIRVGKRVLVPTAKLLEQLGVEP